MFSKQFAFVFHKYFFIFDKITFKTNTTVIHLLFTYKLDNNTKITRVSQVWAQTVGRRPLERKQREILRTHYI